jgi:hypothetical protein
VAGSGSRTRGWCRRIGRAGRAGRRVEEELARELGWLNQGRGAWVSSSVGVRDLILDDEGVADEEEGIESLRLGMLAEGSNETSCGVASGGETGEGKRGEEAVFAASTVVEEGSMIKGERSSNGGDVVPDFFSTVSCEWW